MSATRTRKPATPAPATEVTEAPAPQPNLCKCDCGQATVRSDARYVSGHDARHAGQVGRAVAAGEMSEDTIAITFADQPKLAAKALGVVATAKRKAADKAAKAKAREAAAEAAKQVLAAAGF